MLAFCVNYLLAMLGPYLNFHVCIVRQQTKQQNKTGKLSFTNNLNINI